MAKAVGIIGARLNSTRLPRKHLLDLAGEPLIARIFQRLDHIAELDERVLATTADGYNRPLVDWAEQQGRQVFAYQGDVNDLVGRVDAVVQQTQADIVVYICGDSPLIEPDSIDRLIAALKQHPEVELAHLQTTLDAPLIHEGFDVYSRSLWDRIVAAPNRPEYREHVGSAQRDFSEPARRIAIEEAPIYARLNHRLSVDTVSDYEFMQRIYTDWYAKHTASTLVSLPWVIGRLQQEPALRAINSNVMQKTIEESSARLLLITAVSASIGLGHLSRILVAARTLQDHLSAGVEIWIAGEPVDRQGLQLFRQRWFGSLDVLLAEAGAMSDKQVILIDLPWTHLDAVSNQLLEALSRASAVLVGIDAPPRWAEHFDCLYIPSFFIPLSQRLPEENRQLFGWDSYLLPIPAVVREWQPGRRVAVFTGGSDLCRLGQTLPVKLDAALPVGMEIAWIQGPFAGRPIIPDDGHQQWTVIEAPADIMALLNDVDYALTLFGITFFELLQHGIPTVMFSPYGNRDREMLAALADEKLAVVTCDVDQAVQQMRSLLSDPKWASALSRQAQQRLRQADGHRLVDCVRNLL